MSANISANLGKPVTPFVDSNDRNKKVPTKGVLSFLSEMAVKALHAAEWPQSSYIKFKDLTIKMVVQGPIVNFFYKSSEKIPGQININRVTIKKEV